jgi:hypothetical protein
MRTCLPVRGASVLAVVATMMGAFACSGSPSQPGPLDDSSVLSRPQQPDATSPFPARAQSLHEAPIDTDYLEEELPEETELTAEDEEMLSEDAESAEVYEIDGDDLGSNSLEASDLDAHFLTINAATAGTSSTVKLSGVIFDKNRRTFRIAGVKVKAGRVQTTSDRKGVFTLRIRPGDVKLVFKKDGYKTATDTRRVTSAKTIKVYLTPMPAALSKLSLSDNDVQVGATVNGTVTLTNAAPSGGAKVLLSSTSSTVAKVQSASVTIPAGEKSAPFKVSADSAGTAVIKGTYKNASKTDQLTVIGPEKVVARFEYRAPDNECAIVKNSNEKPQIAGTCIFDASSSTAPADSTYSWDFGGGNTFPNRTSKTLTSVQLECGLPDGLFPRRVYLTVRSPANDTDTTSVLVTFSKAGPC